jgi:hypothetical protein
MSYRTMISITAGAILGIGCVSTEALAYRGAVRAGAFMSAAVIGAALIAEPTCIAGVWALVPLPSEQQ